MSRQERYEVFTRRPDETVECPACDGVGDYIVDEGTCPLCGGTGELSGKRLLDLAEYVRERERWLPPTPVTAWQGAEGRP